MNPLNDLPYVRKALYIVQWVVNGIVVVAGAYFVLNGTAIEDLPKWYVLTNGLAPILWTYLGITAQQNVPSVRDAAAGNVNPADVAEAVAEGRNERGEIEPIRALVIIILAILAVWLIITLVGNLDDEGPRALAMTFLHS